MEDYYLMRGFRLWATIVWVCGTYTLATPVYAQNMTQTRPLDFGTFTIRDFDDPQQIVVLPDDQPVDSMGPGIVSTVPARCGVYELTGLPAFHALTVNVTGGNLTLGGGGKSFTVTVDDPNDIAFDPVDGAGETTLYIGGTLETDGAGHYPDGNYTGFMNTVMNVDINF